MQLRFKTNKLDVARKVATQYVEARAKSYQGLPTNEVSSLIFQWFPALSDADRSTLTTECQLIAMSAVDG